MAKHVYELFKHLLVLNEDELIVGYSFDNPNVLDISFGYFTVLHLIVGAEGQDIALDGVGVLYNLPCKLPYGR